MQTLERYLQSAAGQLILILLFAYPAAAGIRPGFQHTPSTIESEVAHWVARLKSSDVEERREAVIMLSSFEGNAVLPALESALTDNSPRVRAAAVNSVASRRESSIVPLLAPRLTQDRIQFVRKAAAYALGAFEGAERTRALIGALTEKDLEVRGAAAVSLGDHPDADAIAALTNALSDKSAFVRAQAARGLGVNGRASQPAVPTLIRLLGSDGDSEVKRQAATALGLIGDPSAIAALERARQNQDPYLVSLATDAIEQIKKK
ncbi:MAG TPA: HEAT repeat domain-containing protein [Blastocatellia bacterium]|nr:HEAT repeat domain-containing protein [Blastocatellia bacterium]